MNTRRHTLQQGAAVAALLAAAGLWPQVARAAGNSKAFDARSVAEATRLLGATAAPAASAEVTLQAPDIAENGAEVAVTIGTTLAGVKQLVLLVEKNPNVLVAVFNLTDAIEPVLSLRTKMSQSSDVYAVALMRDGRALFARREVRVTLGGCAA